MADTPDQGLAPVAPQQGARQSTLRELNLGLVARQVFAQPGALTRADIAAATGMTRSTVSRLVDTLIAVGLLTEGVAEPRSRRGRPGTPVCPASDTYLALGLEANVAHLAATVVDLTGAVQGRVVVPSDNAGKEPATVLAQLGGLGREVLRDAPGELLSVRVALPGIIDHTRTVLLRAPNLGWSQVNLAAGLRAGGLDLSAGLKAGNEADFAALTIAMSAPGRLTGPETFLYVSGNVGIGSATVRQGQVWSGPHGWAGELGHLCVDPDGLRCGCGARGCLETVAGRAAVLRAAGCSGWGQLLQALERRDPTVVAAIETVGRALGIALSAALNLLDLPVVVLGGHLADLGPQILPVVRTELAERVLAAPFAQVQVELRCLDDEAPAALGAAYAGVIDLLADPSAVVEAHGHEADSLGRQTSGHSS
ncbi:MAG: ROK family transcriptional regulator [Actinomycetia bacterium]|nr:ROK family transcriptional regulator [Actinomycetes bacterium]